jgi:uncharacterized membrane protein
MTPEGPIQSTTLYFYVLIAFAVIAASVIMTWALYWAVKQPPPAALVTALSILTLFAIAGGIVSTSDEAWTIAAAGVGGLAASVTSVFQNEKFRQLHQALEEAPPPVEEQEDELG